MGVGMRDTTRHITHRRAPVSARRATATLLTQPASSRADRVDLLRRLVSAGQYQVNARTLAIHILAVAGVPALE